MDLVNQCFEEFCEILDRYKEDGKRSDRVSAYSALYRLQERYYNERDKGRLKKHEIAALERVFSSKWFKGLMQFRVLSDHVHIRRNSKDEIIGIFVPSGNYLEVSFTTSGGQIMRNDSFVNPIGGISISHSQELWSARELIAKALEQAKTGS